MKNIYSTIMFALMTCLAACFSIGADAQNRADYSGYHAASLNTANNQVCLTLDGGDVMFYNTDSIGVAIDKSTGVVTVSPTVQTSAWSDAYTKTVKNIDLIKAIDNGENGTINNQSGHVVITEAKGWCESAYVKWELYSDASSYNVYIKGGNYTDYTQLDAQQVRNYGTYGRADAVGLVAGTDYSFKVVPVNSSGEEIADTESEATDIAVVNYSRDGFAHSFRSEGVGAYNNDGSLKSGAKVLYVTANTAKTITTDVITSSKSSITSCTGIQAIINAYQKGYDTTPITFRIIGKIDSDDLDYMGSSSEGLQVKGRNSYSTMNITIEGIGDDATVYGFGFLLRNVSSVELRNFAIMRCLDDCISIDTDNSNIWIHNIDFFYGQAGGDSDQAKGDGTVDVKGDSQYITISYNRFWDSGKSSLCGMTSETGPNYITYHHNWFDHSDSRHPRVRTMSVHVWNNYFDGVSKYGVGATTGSSVFVESNFFRGTKRPMMSSRQGTDAKGDGTFSNETGGIIKSYGNVFAEKSSNFSYITYETNNTSFDAYETDTRDAQVPASVVTLVGGTSYNNFDTDSNIMYSYTADPASKVPSVVTGYYGAGRLGHGDFTYDLSGTDENYSVDTKLSSAIDSYTSSLVGIFGDENASSGETGGDSGETGGDTSGETIEGSITCNFADSAPSNSAFTVVGNYSSSKGSATVNGVTYTTCLKLESSTSVTFTTSQQMTMTLYFGNNDTKCNLKIDGTKAADAGAVIDTTAKTLTITLDAGEHVLTKQDTGNLFFIQLDPVTE
ncbi:MAG: pectate lyase [Prevotellaceae bacterium]|nr:pectate lyase [Prevotellaceae bacterium]